ncbi:MAG TPA: hypothetical protein VIM12_11460 [Noviherbaspirillum sp.]|uniref:hypothetical protein n=1 Tax=Noviherbaspirillum sp. TaxID=1926288 RepID=UPI002F93CAB3
MYRYSSSNPSRITWLMGGVAAGLLAMYFGDRVQGKGRRAVAVDRLRSAVARSGDAMGTASRDLGNRLKGLQVRTRRAMSGNKVTVDDDILVARVRQRIGRAVSHPRAVVVTAQRGSVTLSGPVLAREKLHLLSEVKKVLGVLHVEDGLTVHEQEDGIPGLQGGRPRTGSGRADWPPAWRAAAVAAGGTLAAFGLSGRSPARVLSGLAGIGMMARGIGSSTWRRLAAVAGAGEAGQPAFTMPGASAPMGDHAAVGTPPFGSGNDPLLSRDPGELRAGPT